MKEKYIVIAVVLLVVGFVIYSISKKKGGVLGSKEEEKPNCASMPSIHNLVHRQLVEVKNSEPNLSTEQAFKKALQAVAAKNDCLLESYPKYCSLLDDNFIDEVMKKYQLLYAQANRSGNTYSNWTTTQTFIEAVKQTASDWGCISEGDPWGCSYGAAAKTEKEAGFFTNTFFNTSEALEYKIKCLI